LIGGIVVWVITLGHSLYEPHSLHLRLVASAP